MVAQPQTQSEQSEHEIIELWHLLSDEHQEDVLRLARTYARLDQADADIAEGRKPAVNQGLIDLLNSWIAEAEAATPEERAQGEIEFEDFKHAMNENRAPLPPLYL